MNFDEGCILCGKELIYSQEDKPHTCEFCGKEFSVNVSCPEGHFICNHCHSASGADLIEGFCNHTELTDPGQIAVLLMKHQQIKMHGPEHHFLVPASLLAAYYNHLDKQDYKSIKIHIARKRAEYVLGGFCGSHGNCGAAVGTGIFMSIITGNTPLAEKEWQMSNTLTGTSLLRIAKAGGPRCCKRDSFIAIAEAVNYLSEHLNVNLPLEPIACSFSSRNKQCKLGDCEYFPGSNNSKLEKES
ncbi:MAG: SAM-dependent methyltransferase [Bacteroidetes bacterium]|nr:SAM-dependent methyltransferase [Bacteroidota bacterium]